TATSSALAISVGLIGSGAGDSAYAEVTNEAKVEALVGATSVMTVPGAPVRVLATSDNTASADADGGSGSVLVSIAVMLSTAMVGGGTRAEFDGTLVDGTIDAALLDVEALGKNTATATVTVASVALAGGAGATATAEVTPFADVEALVGSTASIALTGALTVSANATSLA